MSLSSNENGSAFIEENKHLSESILWPIQREYFDKQSIHAWVHQVPFYITSNPFISNCYAQIILNFILDWTHAHPKSKKYPFYILELGTGSGRFSFYTIKILTELLHTLQMSHIRICYVMSDITQHNINYYKQHPALLPYIKQGLIDFAIYNMEINKPITLLEQGISLDAQTLHNPLIVFANYIFDSISQDAFTVSHQKLYELLISLKTTADNIKNNRPIHLDKMEIIYQQREITSDYYSDPKLNQILEEYKMNLDHTSFLFPIGSINAIQYLCKISNQRLLLISSDKGYNTLNALDHHKPPSLSLHGSFSLMVNFHAIAQYFKSLGGDYFMQSPRKGIKTSVFSYGFKLKALPHTSLALTQYLEGFSPADYFTSHRRVVASSNEESHLETLAAHLHLTHWDPHVYLKLKKRILHSANTADPEVIEYMASNMSKLANNFYYLPKTDCILFEIGVFFHTIKHYQQALDFYQCSRPYIHESFNLYYNMALCLYQLGKKEQALTHFQHALDLKPESKETQEWLAYLKKPKNHE